MDDQGRLLDAVVKIVPFVGRPLLTQMFASVKGLEDDMRWLRQSALAPTLARLCDRTHDSDGAVLRRV